MSLTLSSQQLIDAAEGFGTPLYVYHAERVKEQYEKLLTAFHGSDTRFFYAAKALTNINILKYIKSIGCNVDCSSFNEVQLALKAGFSTNQILYTSNNISFDEIKEAKEAGVYINIDSLSNLEKFGKTYGNSYPVGIRIRPNIMAGGNLKIATGHSSSKFGIPIENIEAVLKLQQETNLLIRTLHIHTGSEIKDVSVFVEGLNVLLDLVKKFPDLSVIDLGGGFKVPYKKGEVGTDVQELAKRVKEKIKFIEKETGRHFQVWFEPGKFIVSEAGYFITKVNVLKQSGEILFAGVDSGMNHLIRPMFYDAWHEIENISNLDGTMKKYNVVGNICETDTFATARELTEIREGDYLVFRNAGAYGFEMASNYNSRYRPAEILFIKDVPYLIRRRENLEDLTKNQIEDINF